MIQAEIIAELTRNKIVFQGLFDSLSDEMITWKPSPQKWSLLEIICHLHDEERQDFRARTKKALEDPMGPLSSINPVGWVTERNYLDQEFKQKTLAFLDERETSIQWLASLQNPNWDSFFVHPELGEMSANLFLSNWLVHDYLHIRQINRLKFEYLKTMTTSSLDYAGTW
jgi:hypothetical protein